MKRVMYPKKGRGMVSVLLSMAIVASSHAGERRNLITNFDHRERMGIDLPMGSDRIRDGMKVETDRWQAAIDAVARRGGGVVSVPAGRHLVGQLDLKSNVELRLEKGAVLE